MEAIKIATNENVIESILAGENRKKQYFQKVVNRFTNLGIIPNENDLQIIFENPKAYIVDMLTKGEKLTLQGVNIEKEKIFDLIEKPNGTEEVIKELLEDINNERFQYDTISQAYNYIIVKNVVMYSDEFLKRIERENSVYIENKNQQKGFELLSKIVNLINEVNGLDVNSKLFPYTELSNIIDVKDNKCVLKAKSIKMFN